MTDQELNVMDLKNVDKTTLLELADQSNPQSISIFMPTHRYGKEVNEGQDAIAFKNYVQSIRLALEAQNLRSNDISDLLQPLEDLLDDTQFWRHQHKGLAVFRNPDFFAVYHSPMSLAESWHLDSHFYVESLLPFAHRLPVYCLLQISKNGIKLFKADAYSITPLDLANEAPDGLEAVTKYYDFEEQFQSRTTGRGGAMAMYTSNEDADNKEKDHLLADYFRKIDATVIDMMGTQNLPLILASVEYFQPIYQSINTYPHLRKGGLTGNFDHTQPEELHQMAQELVGDSIDEEKQRLIERYQNSSGGDLVSSDAKEILKAAVTGRIDALFVKSDAQLWGHLDENTLKTTIHDEKKEGDESLIGKVALLTLRNGGAVYTMDEVKLVNNQEPVMMTALFRF